MVYNKRWEQMATPLVRLALILHPGYRVLGKQPDKITTLCKEACLFNKCNCTSNFETNQQPSLFSCLPQIVNGMLVKHANDY